MCAHEGRLPAFTGHSVHALECRKPLSLLVHHNSTFASAGSRRGGTRTSYSPFPWSVATTRHRGSVFDRRLTTHVSPPEILRRQS